MGQYIVTLAIPVYNAELFIKQTLLSALNQTFQSIEFIIVDDKGQDNSMDIIREVIATHPRGKDVRIIDQVYNQKVGAARNASIDNATGEYLFFMDHDDQIAPNCIEILYNNMMEHPVDLVAASFVYQDTNGEISPGISYPRALIEGGEYPLAQYHYTERKPFFVAAWNKLYRTDFIKSNNIRCIPHHLNEDPWLTYQIVIRAKSALVLPDTTLFYTINPKSVCGDTTDKGYSAYVSEQYIEVQQAKRELIRNMAASSVYPALLSDLIFMSQYHAYRILASKIIDNKTKQEFANQLLDFKMARPKSLKLTKSNLKFLMLYGYHRLPLSVRRAALKLSVAINLKRGIRKLIHF